MATMLLFACGGESKTEDNSTEEQRQLTTTDLQDYFNNVVDRSLTFMEEVSASNDLDNNHKLAQQEIDYCDEVINILESQSPDSNTSDTEKEVLALAKSFRQYYTYILNNEIDNSTTEITIAFASVQEIADRCFYGELPPKWDSME